MRCSYNANLSILFNDEHLVTSSVLRIGNSVNYNWSIHFDLFLSFPQSLCLWARGDEKIYTTHVIIYQTSQAERSSAVMTKRPNQEKNEMLTLRNIFSVGCINNTNPWNLPPAYHIVGSIKGMEKEIERGGVEREREGTTRYTSIYKAWLRKKEVKPRRKKEGGKRWPIHE